MGRRRQRALAPLEKQADWQTVEGFPAYEISRDGLVRNRDGKILKAQAGPRGHLRVTLYDGSREGKQRVFIHRLVLQAFVGPPPDGRDDCAHWDGNPTNNSVGNLRWATKRENAEDARRHGTLVVGDKNVRARLSNAQAIDIRARAIAGAPTRDLAQEFGVSLSLINSIVTGKAWAHLGGVIRLPNPRRPVDENAVIAAAKALQGGGESLTQTSMRFGISRQTLRRRLGSASEKLIHSAVIEHWTNFRLPGTLVATLANAGALGQPGLTPGLPDLMVLSPTLPGGVGFIELKVDGGKPSDAQLKIGELIKALGIWYAVTYGRDEPITMLEAWGVVRRQAA